MKIKAAAANVKQGKSTKFYIVVSKKKRAKNSLSLTILFINKAFWN